MRSFSKAHAAGFKSRDAARRILRCVCFFAEESED
jgi:hypothetical protein